MEKMNDNMPINRGSSILSALQAKFQHGSANSTRNTNENIGKDSEKSNQKGALLLAALDETPTERCVQFVPFFVQTGSRAPKHNAGNSRTAKIHKKAKWMHLAEKTS